MYILCKDCKTPIEKRYTQQVRCLPCSNKTTPKKVIHQPVECDNCKEMFEPTNANQKICSKECRKRFKNMRDNKNWTLRDPKARSKAAQSNLNFHK